MERQVRWHNASLKDLRRIMVQNGPVGIYARFVVATREGRGVKLSALECADIVWSDEAITGAVEQALIELYDADREENGIEKEEG